MAFGPIMRFIAKEGLQVELAPLVREEMNKFISPGMQQASVSRYLTYPFARVLEDEYEWFDKVRTHHDQVVWGIWVIENEERKLIGSTSLASIEHDHLYQATTGSLIFDHNYWGKGIASGAHKARMWYTFHHMGIVRLRSEVIHGNGGSLKALERSGYFLCCVERNSVFVEGKLRHMDHLQCLNPADWAWQQWWGEDQPPEEAQKARELTSAAMAWAAENVRLP